MRATIGGGAGVVERVMTTFAIGSIDQEMPPFSLNTFGAVY